MNEIAVLGYGTIGSGVVEVLHVNKDSIAVKAEQEISVKYILDLRDFSGTPYDALFIKDYEKILNDDSVKIVVEAMGGLEPAYSYAKEALLRGKSVITSNKEVVAKHGAELIEIASKMKCNFLFEASVGGGIPIIRPLNQALTADKIEEITGILNGTTNFILTKMSTEGLSFEDVLKEAQREGYAERNPAADVEGHDACRKIAILSSLAFGKNVNYEEIYTEGITKITDEDIKYAKCLGYEIKLLATAKKVDDQVLAMVAPMMIGKSHPLSNVHGVFNAVMVRGNMVGDVMFYGRGAGKLPTASAVVADVIDVVKHQEKHIKTIWASEAMELVSVQEAMFKHFVLAKTDFMDAAKDSVAKLFGHVQYVQLKKEASDEDENIAFVTEKVSERDFKDKIALLAEEAAIVQIKSNIRVEE